MRRVAFALLALTVPSVATGAPPKAGFTSAVPVSGPTRIDWTFVSNTQSLAEPPAKLSGADYDSKKQSYDLFLPERKDAKKPIPCIVWVSATDDAAGFKVFEKLCKDKGIAFVGVRGAGNGVPPPKRARVVLDCLDDLRRQVPLDADRTYIGGFSGGARIACAVAFALPEYFGGVIPVCGGGEMRAEPWLRHRLTERTSVALITGEDDFNRGEIEHWRATYWKDLGLRTRVWVEPEHGHTMPPAKTFAEVLKWLDDDAPRRAAFAKKAPASRATPDGAKSRADDAKALFDEAKAQLSAKELQFRGLMQLKGVAARWPDLASGKAALKLLTEYDGKTERPWEVDDLADQIRGIVAEARGLSAYATKGIPAGSQYEKQRPAIAGRAIELWGVLVKNDPQSAEGKEGAKWIATLEPLAKKK